MGLAMTDVTFTFRVDSTLEEAFIAMAEEQDLSAAQILRKMMREAVEEHRQGVAHDRWVRREIKSGMREADLPQTPRLSGEAVEDEWQREKDEIKRRDCQ